MTHPESIFSPDRPLHALTREQRLARPALGLQHEPGQSIDRMWEVLGDQRHAAWLKKNGVGTGDDRRVILLEPAAEIGDLALARSTARLAAKAADAGWTVRSTISVALRPAAKGAWTYVECLVLRLALPQFRAWGAWERTNNTGTFGWDAGQTLNVGGWPAIVNATGLDDFVSACGDPAGIMQLTEARAQRAAEAKAKRETSKMIKGPEPTNQIVGVW